MEIERLTVEEIKSSIIQKLERNYGCEIEDATRAQLYDALAQTVKDEVMRRRTASRGERKRQKCQEAVLSVRRVSGGTRAAQQHGFARERVELRARAQGAGAGRLADF